MLMEVKEREIDRQIFGDKNKDNGENIVCKDSFNVSLVI